MALNLPTLAEMRAKPLPCPKGASRLQAKKAEKKLTLVTEKDFRHEVWTRDKGHCRRCLRKVIKTIERIENSGQVHHIHGRTGDLRYESRAACLLCLGCHEPITGRVAEKIIIVATKTFVMHGKEYTDARAPLTFKRVA